MKIFIEYTGRSSSSIDIFPSREVRFRPASDYPLKGLTGGRAERQYVQRPRSGWPRVTAQGKCEKMLGVDLTPLRIERNR